MGGGGLVDWKCSLGRCRVDINVVEMVWAVQDRGPSGLGVTVQREGSRMATIA